MDWNLTLKRDGPQYGGRQRYRQRVQAEFVSELDELPGVIQSPAQLFEVFELHERSASRFMHRT